HRLVHPPAPRRGAEGPDPSDRRGRPHARPRAGAGLAGRVVYTNEVMVHHLTDMSREEKSGWGKQPYFAVTVPEHMGLEPYFTLEGLVYRVNRDSLQGGIDVEKTHKALYETFKYRGLFKADGSWDSTVYKDENASTLTRNYAAAHLQLA